MHELKKVPKGIFWMFTYSVQLFRISCCLCGVCGEFNFVIMFPEDFCVITSKIVVFIFSKD